MKTVPSTNPLLFGTNYLTIFDVGVARHTIFEEIWLGAGLKTGDFVHENLGGATVKRIVACVDRGPLLYSPRLPVGNLIFTTAFSPVVIE